MRTQYVGMNCQLPPFTDRRVRQALNFAVNKTKLLQLINNRGVVAKGFVPPNMPGLQSGGARLSIRSAARPPAAGGGGLPERLQHDAVGAVERGHAAAGAVAAAGFRRRRMWRCGSNRLRGGRFSRRYARPDLVPMFLLGWEADFPDPSNFLEVLLHSKYIGTNNNTNYRNPELDALSGSGGAHRRSRRAAGAAATGRAAGHRRRAVGASCITR